MRQIIQKHSSNSVFISLSYLLAFSKALNVPAWSQPCTTGGLREDSPLGPKIKKKHSLRPAKDSPGKGEPLGTKVLAGSSNYPTPCAESPSKANSGGAWLLFTKRESIFFFYQNCLTVNSGVSDSKIHIVTGCYVTLPPK